MLDSKDYIVFNPNIMKLLLDCNPFLVSVKNYNGLNVIEIAKRRMSLLHKPKKQKDKKVYSLVKLQMETKIHMINYYVVKGRKIMFDYIMNEFITKNK